MLYAQDLERTSDWYCKNLGFQLGEHQFHDFVELTLDGKYVMHLFKTENKVIVTKPVFSLNTRDIESAHSRLLNNGVEVFPIESYRDHQSFSFKDNEGNMLMISQYI
ncbi:hypothetical protein BVG16_27180 [Paenibacillus selenitireducens]|uniref:VOC domain-containing protein n=1 Tax=Paenibacillus selenitireducens TaxID=1324314 RepID=A0A1T2X1L8_9BACL|nr:VOC family protein [Paenibacillus selenitireducens]OPA73769.1 hypothetical protein BVG16_27180 [Paenibacillus selenitireducens]